MDTRKLKTELAGEHPVSGAYSADDGIAAAQFNAKNIDRNRTSMSGREVAENIVDAEYDALSDAQKSQVLALVAADSIDPFGFAANVIKGIFDAGSATVAALSAARVESISRATQLGLGTVKPGHVQEARRLTG